MGFKPFKWVVQICSVPTSAGHRHLLRLFSLSVRILSSTNRNFVHCTCNKFLRVTTVLHLPHSGEMRLIIFIQLLLISLRAAVHALPTRRPTRKPSPKRSRRPTRKPSTRPSRKPLPQPSTRPTRKPSPKRSRRPTRKPSTRPSRKPLPQPSTRPTRKPSVRPSRKPSVKPSARPTGLYNYTTCVNSGDCASGYKCQPDSKHSLNICLQDCSQTSCQDGFSCLVPNVVSSYFNTDAFYCFILFSRSTLNKTSWPSFPLTHAVRVWVYNIW